MQVEINNQDSIQLTLLGHVIFGTDPACDVVLNESDDQPRKICSIIYEKSACILEVFNQEQVDLNNITIKEMAILHPGDHIQIDHHSLILIDENALPKACTSPFKMIDNDEHNELITSVSGLRSFNTNTSGQLNLVGNQSSFTHKPLAQDDIPFSVSYINDQLTILCQKDKHIFINGNKANYAILKNGDYITTGVAKYCVESPGTSAFSKYSPSHPRNIQLSEEYLLDNTEERQPTTGFMKNNLWWITLILGLIVFAMVLYILKNS